MTLLSNLSDNLGTVNSNIMHFLPARRLYSPSCREEEFSETQQGAWRAQKGAARHLLACPFGLNHRERCSFVESQKKVYKLIGSKATTRPYLHKGGACCLVHCIA